MLEDTMKIMNALHDIMFQVCISNNMSKSTTTDMETSIEETVSMDMKEINTDMMEMKMMNTGMNMMMR